MIEEHIYGVYKIAGHSIEIESHYPEVHRLCEAYRVEDKPELKVSVSMEDLKAGWQRIEEQIHNGEIAQQEHSLAYLEIVRIYKKISEYMPFWDTFMLHGSAIAVDGHCYVFSAKSGTGKSTHSRLWRDLLGNHAVMVNDDKPLIKIQENGIGIVYGTPWDGKHRLSSNTAVPLKSICLLERSEKNWIHEIDEREAFPMLLQQVYRPYTIEAMEKTIELVQRMKVRFYRLGCNMDISAADLSYNKMKG